MTLSNSKVKELNEEVRQNKNSVDFGSIRYTGSVN